VSHFYDLLTHWPPGKEQVYLYEGLSLGFFLLIALLFCVFTAFNIAYLMKCAVGGAGFLPLFLIFCYPFVVEVRPLLTTQVIEYTAMVGAVLLMLLSLHTLFKGP
jgi:hypothetical protein